MFSWQYWIKYLLKLIIFLSVTLLTYCRRTTHITSIFSQKQFTWIFIGNLISFVIYESNFDERIFLTLHLYYTTCVTTCKNKIIFFI